MVSEIIFSVCLLHSYTVADFSNRRPCSNVLMPKISMYRKRMNIAVMSKLIHIE